LYRRNKKRQEFLDIVKTLKGISQKSEADKREAVGHFAACDGGLSSANQLKNLLTLSLPVW
jgi:hypothetical protein